MESTDFSVKAKKLIDDIKGICANAGLGGDANEYKIVTQSFLYKFLNDKFLFEVGKIDPSLKSYDDLVKLSKNDYELLLIELGTKAAHLKPEHLLEHLFKHQNDDSKGFAEIFDDTLNDIALDNSDVFSVHTAGNTEIRLFEEELIQDAINDKSKRNETASKIINSLANSKFDFDVIFSAGFDFFSTLFEYMIKDYNKDGGSKYAEYYTPHSIAKIMAEILVGDTNPVNVTAYDPAAGSGTLLMNIAHKIGPNKCFIYSEDISQKSSNLLRLNLILNNLSHSIDHIVQGNTITEPNHITKKFDYIVSNPPFKIDFAEDHEKISNLPNVNERFFAGVPNIKPKAKDKMEIYLLFLQHIIYSLSENGKAAIVVPSGFCTDTGTVHEKVRQHLIDNKFLKGVIHFPANVFASTNTSVSVIFIDKSQVNNEVMLVDASKLGKTLKEDGITKTILQPDELLKICHVFLAKIDLPEFSKCVKVKKIQDTEYLIKAGLYFSIDKVLLVDNRKDINYEKSVFNQKRMGLMTVLSDKLFRNLMIDEVVKAEAANSEGWLEQTTLFNLLDKTMGGDWGNETSSGKFTEPVKCIRGTDIPNIRTCNYEDIPTRYVKKDSILSKILKPNDIVVEISGGSPIQSTGRICLITKQTINDIGSSIICTNFCRVLRFKDSLTAVYVYHYLMLLYEHGQMFNLENNTSGIKNLIFSAFTKNVIIPIPIKRSTIQDICTKVEKNTKLLLNRDDSN